MSGEAEKLNQIPESYGPKKPEIIRMAEKLSEVKLLIL